MASRRIFREMQKLRKFAVWDNLCGDVSSGRQILGTSSKAGAHSSRFSEDIRRQLPSGRWQHSVKGSPVAWFLATAGVGGAVSSFSVSAGSYYSTPYAQAEETATSSSTAAPTVSKPSFSLETKPRIVFVLGGPGSGKGTQCAKIVDDFGFVHLSAGDLLRAEINSGSENGNMIKAMIKEGKIVPAEVTVGLLQKAMKESDNYKFLIDGFPRNEENRMIFERDTGLEPEFILFFDCPEEVMEKRLLGRNQGRIDDNIETIRKRFKTFIESSMPVIEHYEKLDKVKKINATRAPDEVFKSLTPLFLRFLQD
eukprot:TRINITY_DN35427_c0_g1_i1.p1 TRINITY_DN35427_c0_g1~~TRINITY_DN35427_c0_g1_i1.p1  ORF type:complete len:349 (-),score=62.98 TRINITY_DN35427_c0_g1_i1:836-1765(-)